MSGERVGKNETSVGERYGSMGERYGYVCEAAVVHCGLEQTRIETYWATRSSVRSCLNISRIPMTYFKACSRMTRISVVPLTEKG